MTTPAPDLDWSILEVQEVADIITTASAKLANIYGGITSAEDVAQDASIWLASNAGLVRDYLTDAQLGPRAVYRRMYDRQLDRLRVQADEAARMVPFNGTEGSGEE